MNNIKTILSLGINAKKASELLSGISGKQKNEGLEELKKNLIISSKDLIAVNKIDIKNYHVGSKIRFSSLMCYIINFMVIDNDRPTTFNYSCTEMQKDWAEVYIVKLVGQDRGSHRSPYEIRQILEFRKGKST